MLTPAVLLEACEDALADTPWWRPGKIALELVGSRNVLGERGQPVGAAAEHRFGFTRSQVKRMREVVLAAARADAGIG